ncbi:uncharacterized protein teq isoform X3 [Eurosta solidaginis]|uniref:uncharacterized protein teq isoform X3 n=1 Tax=Eurosta solidaginis TaxID=178769 RepID=UPI003531204E
MFLKLWLLICATQLVIINGTYDSAYGGIKTKPYQRGYPNPEEHHHHHSPTDELYPNPSTYDIRASSSGYDNLNKGDTSARLSPSDAHQHYVVPGNQQTLSHKQQQHQYQQQRSTPQADAYQQRKLPIYDRNAHVRHTPTVTGAWSVGAAPNTITDFPTGCPPGHTGPVPYAYDCRRFVNCWHGRGHIQSCGPGTVFNPETLECDRPDKVVCGGSPNAKDIGDKELNEKQIMPRNEPKQNEYRDGRLLDANNDNVQTLCPVGVDGLAPHPNDCTKFLNCANGKTHVQSCGPGTAFSISMKVCDFKEKVDCIGRDGGVGSLSSRDARKYDPPNYQDRNLGGNALQSYEDENNIFCLPGLSGLFPYPFDYTKFLNCKSGNTAIQNCMPGTVFSVSRNYCDEKEKVPYSDHIPYTVSEAGYEFSLSMINCPPSTDGIHLYPYGPTKYINCQRGQMTVIACPPNTQFCLSTKTCRPEYEVVTGDRVRNAVELNSNADNRDSRHSDLQYLDQLFECPKDQSALYPHPFDCNKYLQCRNGRLTIETCRPGYVFSLSAKHCDPKALVGAKQQVQFELDDGQNRQSESGYDYRTIQLTCPPNVNGYFLHPFDCTKYLLCHDGQSLVEACKSGKVFSISRRQCINRNQVDAYDRVEYQSEVKHEFSTELEQTKSPGLEKMCLRAASGFHPHPTDNTKYVKCTNGLAMIESCLEGLIFSKARKHCDYESKVFEYDRDYSGFIGGNESEFKTQSKVYTDEINSDGYDNWKAFIGGEASRDFYNERAPVNADSGAPVQCPANVEGMYPHPLDCQKFLICSNGITHIKDCALGTAWNVEMEVCDFENNVKCAQHPKPPSSKIGHVISDNKIECPPNAKGRYLHPFDPRKYINCNEEGTRIQNCPSGSVFSISRSMCLVEEEVNTVDFVQCTQDYSMELSPTYYNYVACPPAALGYFIYPFDGLLFISCHNGQTMIQNCSPQTLFSISNKICIPINEAESNDHLWLGSDREDANLKSYGVYDGAGSTIIPTSGSTHTLTSAQTLSSPVCPGDDGLYPHPTDCTQFLRCANGISYVQQCGPGTAFNAALEVCDLKNRVDCSGRESLAAGENRDVSSYSVACPSGVSGVYPHPFDCKKFLNCNNGIENIQDCGAGTAWNAKIEVCDFIERVDCSNNGGLVAGEPKANTGYGHNINANLQPPALPSQPFYIGSTTSQSNWPQDGREAPTPFQRETPYGNPNINSNLPTPTPPRAYGDRWSNMNRQRPLASDSIYTPDSLDRQRPLTSDSVYVPERTHSSGYDRPPHRTSPSWTGTGSSTSGQTPAHTTIYEEGSLVPNREQHSLTTNPTQTSHYPDPSKELYSKNTKHESKTNTNWQTNGHNPEFHRSHPNLLNPFAGDEYSSPHNHHNHHNQLHNKAFHQRHPEMPSPFVAPTIPPATHEPATEREIPQNPRAESTTPFSVRPEIDLRSGFDCQFDCGNGKCVKSFEVCNGINNCGNRKDEEDCKHLGYEVRLAGGESPNMGRIEVKILGKWGYICDDKFGLRDAEVVCRELGFKLGASEVRGYSYYPPTTSDVSFVMDEVDCRGDESSLKDCNFKGWGVSNCGPDEVVGVVCKVPQLKCPNNYWLCTTSQECIPPAFVCDHTPDCADKSDESPNVCNSPVKYRMGGGRSPNEGRLEVRYHGEWGTVCDDDFGMKEAQVLCNYMGFYGLPHIEKNKYGPGAGPIWLDQVSCFGNETSLDQCNHWTWGEHNCNHTEDVGLKCTVGAPPKKRTQAASQKLNTDENAQKDLDDAQQELEDIGLFPDEWERKSKAVGTQRRCGHFKDNINDEYAHPEERVVNGSTAKRGHHPWQATIRTRGRGGISSHWCGAVLISSRHLLTAAHCLAGYPKGAYLIRLGDHYANIAESSEIDSFIENWYVHEKFRDATHMNNDIALIVLKTPVKFNDYIQPVCLPLKGATLTENRKCTISGWGSIKSGVSTPSNILRAAELPILSNEVCKQPHVYGASLTEGMFCAGYMDESVDACDGDSGGPLICHDEDGETLYGIISWGQHCGYANKPGVYVRVEKYVDWILEKINFSIQNTS